VKRQVTFSFTGCTVIRAYANL